MNGWGLALTEPNTGSDAMRMKCTAQKDGDHWVLNGTKCWITHGISSDVVVAIVIRTGELLDSNGSDGLRIERGTPGLKAGKKENKLGMRASETAEGSSRTAGCRRPMCWVRWGKVKQAMKVLDGGRISIAALSLGIAHGAYDASVAMPRSGSSLAGPSPISRPSPSLADMATRIEAAES
ncbi:MAG: acyl-CoA dehydrogenase family protein [Flavobacteriales bacterium]